MPKKKTPEQEHMKKVREALLPFHDPSTIKAGIPLEPRTLPLTLTIQQWEHIDPLLVGLEDVIPPERFQDWLRSAYLSLMSQARGATSSSAWIAAPGAAGAARLVPQMRLCERKQ